MSQPLCACASFNRLEGASVNAYITSFLERKDADKNLLRCRICGREWQKVETEGKRASLVRMTDA